LLIERQKKRVKFLDSSQAIEIKKQKHGRKFSGKIFSSPMCSKSLNGKGLEPAGKIFSFISASPARGRQHNLLPLTTTGRQVGFR